MTELTQKQVDRNKVLAERNWWDFWNTSYRLDDGYDEISTELFANVTAVIREITWGQTKSILEVACGTGTLSRQLEFSSYHGLDVSPTAIGIASSKAARLSPPEGTERPTYELADVHDWPLPSRLFDVAVCVDAVAYFRDQQLALNKIARVLTPSGQLVLTTINPFVYNRIRRTAQNP